MKIIFSRKGFDSTYGGKPSPIIDNHFYSMPIPEEKTGISYENLKFRNEKVYSEFLESIKFNKKEAHLDPDLRKSILSERKEGWKKAFGQRSQSQKHLENNKVIENDIFLFFGWFQFVEFDSEKYKYKPLLNEYPQGFHVLFGYLQIGKIIKVKDNNYEDWLSYHPHIVLKEKSCDNNTIYVATDKLTIDSNKPGAGLFKFNRKLILTKENATRSIWCLPEFFHPTNNVKISYHYNQKSWIDNVTLKTVARGQEFVVHDNSNSDVEKWVKKLFETSEVIDD